MKIQHALVPLALLGCASGTASAPAARPSLVAHSYVGCYEVDRDRWDPQPPYRDQERYEPPVAFRLDTAPFGPPGSMLAEVKGIVGAKHTDAYWNVVGDVARVFWDGFTPLGDKRTPADRGRVLWMVLTVEKPAADVHPGRVFPAKHEGFSAATHSKPISCERYLTLLEPVH